MNTTQATSHAAQRAAVYARYSTDRQDARSIDDQVRRCREHAARNGWEVHAVYADAALSGSHTERPELQRLLDAVARSRGQAFGRVIVDDLSRLSRDLWDMGRIVFNDLASFAVPVTDVMTSTSSDAPSARQLFAALGMGSDLFLQMVKTETHRGLEGRALAGFWTGGRVYGYAMVREQDPPDPQYPRALPTVDPFEAAVVRRIFRLSAEGHGFASIARTLNSENLPAPYDRGAYRKPRGRGWASSTIRALLENERYIGWWVWNKRKWVRVPGMKSKRSVRRPREEWIERERPELAIVDRELWDAVRARFAERTGAGGGRWTRDQRASLLSGLLRCGACGSHMQLTGSRTKGGALYRYFGCAAQRTRGADVCANAVRVSEANATAAIVDALGRTLCEPRLRVRFLARFKARVALARAAPRDREDVTNRAQLSELEKRVRNLTDAVARSGWSAALAQQLKDDEGALAVVKARSEHASAAVRRMKGGPPSQFIERLLERLPAVLQKDRVRARTLLKKYVGPIVMTPAGEGESRRYEAAGNLGIEASLPARPSRAHAASQLPARCGSKGHG